MSTQYSLTCHNKSSETGNFMVFQKAPDIGAPGVYSLAWFVKRVHPGTDVEFDWSIDYSFVWCETGILQPGVKFRASQTMDADPTGGAGPNFIGFTMDDGAYEFTTPGSGGEKGSLTIVVADPVPAAKAAVGIGMSGAGTFAVQARPNATDLFTPHPTYWIAFGDFETGVVLDMQQISRKQQLTFAPNVYHLDVTFDDAGHWTVQSLAARNAAALRRLVRAA